MSASHAIRAGNDLFTGKSDAYIMNSVLDLYVKVPAGASAPMKYQPVKVDTVNQVAGGRGLEETSEI